jgi:hypothetical protein
VLLSSAAGILFCALRAWPFVGVPVPRRCA